MYNQFRKSRHGFTLIELLVVIVIILVLAAILFPVFLAAREKARQVKCVSNMRQIGIAINAYLQDSNGLCPPAGNIWTWDWPEAFGGSDAVCRAWYPCLFDLLEPYVKNDAIYSCDTMPHKEAYCYRGDMTSTRYTETWVYNNRKYFQSTYTTFLDMERIGYVIPAPAPYNTRYNRFAQLAFHGRPGSGGVASGLITNLYRFNYSSLNGLGEQADSSNCIIVYCMASGWATSIGRFAYNGYHIPGRHLDAAVLLFADGHVKAVNWSWFGA